MTFNFTEKWLFRPFLVILNDQMTGRPLLSSSVPLAGDIFVMMIFFLFLIKDDVTEDEKDEVDEKNRLISQVLELQNTLDGKQQ